MEDNYPTQINVLHIYSGKLLRIDYNLSNTNSAKFKMGYC